MLALFAWSCRKANTAGSIEVLLSDAPAFNMFMHSKMCNKRSICSLLRLAVFSTNGREMMV